MSTITVLNPLPSEFIALSDETMSRANALAASANAITAISCADELRACEGIFKEIRVFADELDEGRLALKRPIIELGKQIDAAAGEALAPLVVARSALGKRISIYIGEENQRRMDEAAKATRLLREEQQAAIQARAAAAAAAPHDASVSPEPGEEPAAPEPLYEIRATVLKSSAVKTTKRAAVKVINITLVPRELFDLDEKKVLALLKAGIAVPGCELTYESTVGAK